MKRMDKKIGGKRGLSAGFCLLALLFAILIGLSGCTIEFPDEAADDPLLVQETQDAGSTDSTTAPAASGDVSPDAEETQQEAQGDQETQDTAESPDTKETAGQGGTDSGKTGSSTPSSTAGKSTTTTTSKPTTATTTPKPVEPEDAEIDEDTRLTCTLSIRCDTILDNMDLFNKDKLGVLPEDGVIYAERTVTFYEGESVFDVLLRETKKNRIHMEFERTPLYNSNYIEGINNLYEMDCGEGSGWMYKVNGWFPNYGCSRYQLKQGDRIEWLYTCDLGYDVGRTGTWDDFQR